MILRKSYLGKNGKWEARNELLVERFLEEFSTDTVTT